MNLEFAYTILHVPDVAGTVEFYQRAFGFEPVFVHDSGAYAELSTGLTTLAFAEQEFAAQEVEGGCHPNNRDGRPAGLTLTFTSPDPVLAYASALDAGATGVHEPVTRPWGQVVGLLRDCNGVLVEIATPLPGR